MKLGMLTLATVGFFLVAADDPKAEQAKLQGTWLVVAAERNGKKSPAEELKQVKPTLTIKGDKLSTSFQNNGKEVTDDTGSFKIDPSTKPKSIDLTGFPVPGKTFKGIYELDGDMLKICIGETDRPKEFASKAESKTGLLMLKKVKK
jgi:uncharacterized protein (TIGR03067 family)